ncbi:MAG: hypothetical protein GXO79_04025 [Chlorobi bacterium]|nr:hypothetical protein [Chlorobiota bacterium]
MKQYVYLALITFLGFIQSIIAQEQTNYVKSYGIHIMPYTLLDYTPRLRLGIDYNTGSKLGYSFDVGIGSFFLNKNRLDGMIWNEDYSFNEVRLELKYFVKKNSNSLFYCSTELFNIIMSDNIKNGYFHKENSSSLVFYDVAEFNKHKLGLHLKSGIELILFKRIDFDFYGGIGVAYRNIYYKNVVKPDIGEYNSYVFEEWGGHSYKYEGKTIMLHFTLGIKAGFIFSKK